MNALRELRQKHHLSQTDIAKFLGVAQNTVSNWEKGNRQIDIETAKKLSEYFDCSLDYLLGNARYSSNGMASVRIPVLGYVKAGLPIEAVENIVDYEEIPEQTAKNGEYFGLSIKGDSMEPRMREGDVVIVRKQSGADSGDIVIALINGCEATVKKYIRHSDGISLVAYNTHYDPMFFTKHDIETIPVSIIGKVVELRAKF